MRTGQVLVTSGPQCTSGLLLDSAVSPLCFSPLLASSAASADPAAFHRPAGPAKKALLSPGPVQMGRGQARSGRGGTHEGVRVILSRGPEGAWRTPRDTQRREAAVISSMRSRGQTPGSAHRTQRVRSAPVNVPRVHLCPPKPAAESPGQARPPLAPRNPIST